MLLFLAFPSSGTNSRLDGTTNTGVDNEECSPYFALDSSDECKNRCHPSCKRCTGDSYFDYATARDEEFECTQCSPLSYYWDTPHNSTGGIDCLPCNLFI